MCVGGFGGTGALCPGKAPTRAASGKAAAGALGRAGGVSESAADASGRAASASGRVAATSAHGRAGAPAPKGAAAAGARIATRAAAAARPASAKACATSAKRTEGTCGDKAQAAASGRRRKKPSVEYYESWEDEGHVWSVGDDAYLIGGSRPLGHRMRGARVVCWR